MILSQQPPPPPNLKVVSKTAVYSTTHQDICAGEKHRIQQQKSLVTLFPVCEPLENLIWFPHLGGRIHIHRLSVNPT